MITITCEICEAPFQVQPCRLKEARFCSRACGGVWHVRTRLAAIGKPFAKGNKVRAGLRPTNAWKPGRNAGVRLVEWVKFSCDFCEEEFELPPHIAWRRAAPRLRFCSRQCRGRYRSVFLSGPNSPDWVGGKTTYRGMDWPEARAAVIIDQRGFCLHCEVFKGKSLPVHHIQPFRDFATSVEANVRSNLIGLCQACHMRTEHATGQR